MDAPVVLVNEHDEQIGLADKLLAHQQGLLHRAFSVFVLRYHNGRYEVLLQQRAQHKYHCGSLWTNTCCSHPFEQETIIEAASRRLQEELVPLQKIGVFCYRAQLENGLVEHEIDHVLIGFYEKDDFSIPFNSEEVMACDWVAVDNLREKILNAPQLYTPWILEAFGFVEKYLVSNS
jgi:isopentenyl-diphosphate delta-isomerase type 1